MSLVKDWVGAFLQRHKARYGPGDWPADATEMRTYALAWITALACLEATEDEAEAASLSLLESPPRFRADHIANVTAAIKVERERTGKSTHKHETRDDARNASKDCQYCGGEGLATVYHPQPDLSRRVPATSAAHCVCSHGRFIRHMLGMKSENASTLRRIPDLALVVNGASGWRLDPPPGVDGGDPGFAAERVRLARECATVATPRFPAGSGSGPVPFPFPMPPPAPRPGREPGDEGPDD